MSVSLSFNSTARTQFFQERMARQNAKLSNFYVRKMKIKIQYLHLHFIHDFRVRYFNVDCNKDLPLHDDADLEIADNIRTSVG